ncbi:uncharacterized protein TrAFT101_003167 [Trichoderma asperellum]|uniref:Uncharacterized protein n=1 Tax=Trichoderma asperellum (strain ATCC 204424 / CBS 433.97 / NBRC 101777) TaxID=1042311 RepID=A0A2T3ZIH8_TRIA4|nr:hypothetical protein M441DRAFT_24751 [Trichoderma asperellum CBS 433.97]PTB44618.1 hypothetical protein M441DRAFT_24751 [Trichoderma asperellum CBS 433.97]UKZ87359.1 hypothetical protein TrAFT101_003167 [Trichoderma asperellum]
MQFKALFLAAVLTAQSAYAMASTQQGQIQQNEKNMQSEQSTQIHQLEELAHTIHTQQMAQDGILLVGAPTLNASVITSTLNSVSNLFSTTGTAISAITATTLVQQLPNIITSLSSLSGTFVTNVGSIITTPVIGVFSLADQRAIFAAFTQLVSANTQLINAFLGPNGIVSNSLLRGPIAVVLNLVERTVVNLAGAIIARIPAFAQQSQTLLSSIHASLALTLSV